MRFYPIAIVGSGCVLPPDSTDVEKFWQNQLAGITGIIEIPKERWDVDLYYSHNQKDDEKTDCKYGAFIKNYSFNRYKEFSPAEINKLNRSQQLILDSIIQACGSARIDIHSLHGMKKLGLCMANMLGDEFMPRTSIRFHGEKFIGNLESSTLWDQFTTDEKTTIRQEFVNNLEERFPTFQPGDSMKALSCNIVKEVASLLKLTGKVWTIDAACASGLNIFESAVNNLLTGALNTVIVTGLCGNMLPPGNVAFAKIGGLTQKGMSFPLDHRASGLLPGEGVAAVIIKRLDDAIREGDKVLGVIRGLGNTTDGRGKGIYAPDSKGQLRAMKASLDQAGFTPSHIDYIETHATSTVVGDVVELHAIKELFKQENLPPESVVLGSCKATLGHTFSAAGIANLIKVLKAFEEKVIPKTYNFEKFPDGAKMEGTPFHVCTSTRSWQRKEPRTPRRASINAFGFGGVNSNMVVEEYDEAYHGDLLKQYDVTLESEKNIDIAVVGIGCITGESVQAAEFLEKCINNHDKSTFPGSRWEVGTAQHIHVPASISDAVYPLDPFEFPCITFRIPPSTLQHVDRAQQMMLLATEEALGDATATTITPETTAMSVGVMMGLESAFTSSLRIQYCEYLGALLRTGIIRDLSEERKIELRTFVEKAAGLWPSNSTEDTLPGYMDNIIAARAAKFFDFKGSNITVDADTASFGAALDLGIQSLVLNRCDTMLVGAVHGNLMPDFLRITDDLITTSQHTLCTGCGQNYTNPIFAEGGVAFVLKRYQDVGEEEKVYGRITGISHGHNAHHGARSQCCRINRTSHDKPGELFYFGAHGGFAFLKGLLELHKDEAFSSASTRLCITNHSILGGDYSIVYEPGRPGVNAAEEDYGAVYLGAKTRTDLLAEIRLLVEDTKNQIERVNTPDKVLEYPLRISFAYRTEEELVNKLSYLSMELEKNL